MKSAAWQQNTFAPTLFAHLRSATPSTLVSSPNISKHHSILNAVARLTGESLDTACLHLGNSTLYPAYSVQNSNTYAHCTTFWLGQIFHTFRPYASRSHHSLVASRSAPLPEAFCSVCSLAYMDPSSWNRLPLQQQLQLLRLPLYRKCLKTTLFVSDVTHSHTHIIFFLLVLCLPKQVHTSNGANPHNVQLSPFNLL